MTIEERIINSLDIKDLDEELQFFAEVIGFENVQKLILAVGGNRFYIPKPDKFKTKALEKYIIINQLEREKYSRLSRLFGLSHLTVGRIVNKIKLKGNGNGQLD